jgi:hypothetical protein
MTNIHGGTYTNFAINNQRTRKKYLLERTIPTSRGLA